MEKDSRPRDERSHPQEVEAASKQYLSPLTSFCLGGYHPECRPLQGRGSLGSVFLSHSSFSDEDNDKIITLLTLYSYLMNH